MLNRSADLSKVYHVDAFRNVDTLNEIIDNLNKAIYGKFDEINDPDVSTNVNIAFISPTGVEFYGQDGQQVIDTVPLEEFKQITIAWRDHLSKKSIFKKLRSFINRFSLH